MRDAQRNRRLLAFRGVTVLIAALWFATLTFASPQTGGSILSIAQQEAIVKEAVQMALPDVAQRWGPSVAAQARALCVGSWCRDGVAKATSDLDLTIGHKVPEVAKFMTDRVNLYVDRLTTAAGGSHNIKVIFDGDPAFKELFSGRSGQTFIYQYAERSAIDGQGAWTFTRDASGQWTQDVAHVSEYWKALGRDIPHDVIAPQVFAGEARTMMRDALAHAGSSAEKVAKYMGFIENIIKPGFERQWGLLPGETALDARIASQMQTIIDIKRAGETLAESERRAMLARAFGASTDDELEAAFKRFAAQGDAYFARTTRTFEVYDTLYRLGMANEVGGFAAVSRAMEQILTAAGPVVGGALVAADIAAIISAARTGDGQATADAVANAVLAAGLPHAAVGALAAKMTLELGVKLPANYLVFDPINDRALSTVLDPASAWYLFSPDVVASPFNAAGFKSLDTLACPNPNTGGTLRPDMIANMADRYVRNLTTVRSDIGGVAFSENEGGLRDKLTDVLVAALDRSREKFRQIEKLEENLMKGGARAAADTPLWVWVDRKYAGIGNGATFAKTVAVGQRVSFAIALERDFGTITGRKPPSRYGQVVKKWCDVGGSTPEFYRWLDATLPSQVVYEGGRQPIVVRAAVSGTRGWAVDGGSLGVSPSGGGAALTITGDGVQPFQEGRYTVTFMPGPDAKESARVTLTFVVQDDFGSPPYEVRTTLTASPVQTATPTDARVDDRRLIDALESATRKVDAARAATTVVPPPPDIAGRDAKCVAACQSEFDRWMGYAKGRQSGNGYSYGPMNSNCPTPWNAATNQCIVTVNTCRSACGLYQAACNNPCWDAFNACCFAAESGNIAHDREVCLARCSPAGK